MAILFSYGSNMSTRRLRHAQRAPSARALTRAWVNGYRLVFDKAALDGSAKADCEATGDPTHRVWGALHEIDDAHLAPLDEVEGTVGDNPGYRRAQMVVQTGGGPVQAFAYLAMPTHKQAGLLPYPWYQAHVLAGAREWALPLDYVQELARHSTQHDPNDERVTRELAIYADPFVRREAPGDEPAVRAVTAEAFRLAPMASGTEAQMVDTLRDSGALQLSLVAEVHQRVVGHVAVSPVAISDGAMGWFGLGPIAVQPDLQGQGIGGLLMRAAIEALRAGGAEGCVLLGNPSYYRRFGFAPCPDLVLPGVPEDHFMALHLGSGRPRGQVRYHPVFNANGR